MEHFHRLAIEENSYSHSEESFACSVLASHYMTCLDVAGPGTFTGNRFSPAIDWNIPADQVSYRNISTVYAFENITSGTNLFGIGCDTDSFESTSDSTGRHGDGVVNSLDIGVLVFSMFRDAPYNEIGRFDQVETVNQRPETQSRCRDGRTRSEWQVELGDNGYCPPSLEYGSNFSSFRRQLADTGSGGGGEIATITPSSPSAYANDNNQTSQHEPDHGFVRSRFKGINDLGSWHSLEFAPSIVPIMVELMLHGVWSYGSAQLSNAPPPRDGAEVPLSPDRYQVRWSRTQAQEDYAKGSPSYDPNVPAHMHKCKNIVPGASGTQVIMGDTLSVRQEGVGAHCPFWLHMWVPIGASAVDVRRALSDADDHADLLFVLVKRGSVAMTTTGGFVLNPGNWDEAEAHPPHTPAPPPPPPPPAPPAAPPPLPPYSPDVVFRQLDVSATFSSEGQPASYVVSQLQAQELKLKRIILEYVAGITNTTFMVLVEVGVTATAPPSPSAGEDPGSGTPAVSEGARLLSEVSSGQLDSCAASGTVNINLLFHASVPGFVMRQIRSAWPDLVDLTNGLKECSTEFQNAVVWTTGLEVDEPGEDMAFAVGLSVAAFAIVCLCCSIWAFVIRKSGDEEEEKAATKGLLERQSVSSPLLSLGGPGAAIVTRPGVYRSSRSPERRSL